MTQVYSDPSKADNKWSLPDAEVFYVTIGMAFEMFGHELGIHEFDTRDERLKELEGFYYWFCLPGCLPDSSPIGPFETEAEAIEALRNE